MKEPSLTQNAMNIIQSRGQFGILHACKKIMANQYDNGTVCEALHYYAQTILPNVLPIFPALISLSSKASGAIPKNLQSVAAAMLLITSSGDIHDDIVDNSRLKFSKKTVVGKYGKDIALLAGDLLLIQGMSALQNECNLSNKQKKMLLDLVGASMVEIVKAEALESSLWQKADVTPGEYFEVIKLKGGVAELHCKIGGIIGGGGDETIGDLARYGRVIGILSTLKEEFVDMSSSVELGHRIKRELPPYPLFCAMQNKTSNYAIVFDKSSKFSLKDLRRVSEKVLGSLEVEELTAEFREFGRKELADNPLLKGNERALELVVLLEALAEELVIV
jgi:geranylgeranyl pyrophosphate synthase